MSRISRLRNIVPSKISAALSILAAVLLILAFPDFEIWPLAFVAPVPLIVAIRREAASAVRSFVTGWLFGLVFFFGTCWWLTFAPITYAHMPWLLTYFFMVCTAAIVGVFPGLFGSVLSILLKRLGDYALLSVPFLWIFTEFLRMNLTGNNWNAIGYSQAFAGLIKLAPMGGVYLVGFAVLYLPAVAVFLKSTRIGFMEESEKRGYVMIALFAVFGWLTLLNSSFRKGVKTIDAGGGATPKLALAYCLFVFFGGVPFWIIGQVFAPSEEKTALERPKTATVIAVQPNVPMDGISFKEFEELLKRHFELSETALRAEGVRRDLPVTIIFPESPMIFQYGRDPDLQVILREFAQRNNAALMFNSAEPAANTKRSMNSAVMIDSKGEKIAQYDKIHLLPFGEYIPFPEPMASMMPAFVGNFEFGKEYDLLPFGEAKGGVMICFESHFGGLSREYVRRGADVLIEMTNDGYLGQTPVLRQHLANSVFRAAETHRPLLRITNVGVTAYVNERGDVSDTAEVYSEATRVWTVARTAGGETLYVRFGDWFAWLSSAVTLFLLLAAWRTRPSAAN